MTMKITLLFAVACFAFASGADAQAVLWSIDTQRNDLANLKRIAIQASEPEDDDERPCHPARESLELAAARPLLDAKLSVETAPEGQPTLRISVTALRLTADTCAAFVNVEVVSPSLVVLPHQQLDLKQSKLSDLAFKETVVPRLVEVTYGDAKLHSAGYLLTGARLNFERRILDYVSSQAQEFGTKVRLANQPK